MHAAHSAFSRQILDTEFASIRMSLKNMMPFTDTLKKGERYE